VYVTRTLVYLATPYSHPDPAVREARFRAANRYAADLVRQGVHVLSPVSHAHHVAKDGGLSAGWDVWGPQSYALLAACARVVVLCQDGWQESVGVAAELRWAAELGLPVEYVGTETP
jgi:hypothetical protein